jgi:hypothetical protein
MAAILRLAHRQGPFTLPHDSYGCRLGYLTYSHVPRQEVSLFLNKLTAVLPPSW